MFDFSYFDYTITTDYGDKTNPFIIKYKLATYLINIAVH